MLTRSWPVRTLADHRKLIETNFPGAVDEALRHYGAASDDAALPAVARAFADTQFNHGARLLARCMSRHGAPVWVYRFTRRRPGQNDGPHHGDEVAYVFGQLAIGRDRGELRYDEVDTALSARRTAAWAAFARSADPGAGVSASWPTYAAPGEQILDWGNRVVAGASGPTPALDFVDRFVQSRAGQGRSDSGD